MHHMPFPLLLLYNLHKINQLQSIDGIKPLHYPFFPGLARELLYNL
jgi:hypothetical protein